MQIKSLSEILSTQFGKTRAATIAKKYQDAFSKGYLEKATPDQIVTDIFGIEQISSDNPIVTNLCQFSEGDSKQLYVKLFQLKDLIALSDVLPKLDNTGLRTQHHEAVQFNLDSKTVWVSTFKVSFPEIKLENFEEIKDIFETAFTQILKGSCENDSLNKLIVSAGFTWREVKVIRAYNHYAHQVKIRYSQAYIEKALNKHAAITKKLITLFDAKHNPCNNVVDLSEIEIRINELLTSVKSLEEDEILRYFLQLIKSTLRTNYYQGHLDGSYKPYVSFKFNSASVPNIPLPRPLYEIFVYSSRFEAIHLRSAKVSRGGIRWSERVDDYRTEILGLMKAQKVKNSVIVPSGAKGGFVIKNTMANDLKQEALECYKLFISALLDITDNYVNGVITHPHDVVCHDDEDAYLVVAADKGTATYSDVANSIAKQYGFWLDDAFASGGSSGYDHKKMGITARGVWESVKRHLMELGLDIKKDVITVVGIGDMNGDVFGNGMLYSEHIKLVAAFDHRHIFLDPNPDPVLSFQERKRLFELTTSSWMDYNASLLSQGGGVFSRAEKSIPLSPEIQSLLKITDEELSPHKLIQAILKAPVDLLFNGGVGTYVKSSNEFNEQVGDRTNDLNRINGDELRCRIVGEGGNLGFTQLARIEYAIQGGLINADFIDNSAGVDCSDHEVNIKILLGEAYAALPTPEIERDKLLTNMTDEIARLVLRDNYQQALVLSFSAYNSKQYIGLYRNHIKSLESAGLINRVIESLPSDKRIDEYKMDGHGLTRPELAVLMAYTKLQVKQAILDSDLLENPYFESLLYAEFPAMLVEKFSSFLSQHRLKREIIATQLSNQMINTMGITFVYRVQSETGASIADIVRAQKICAEIYDVDFLVKYIESIDGKIPSKIQYDVLHQLRQLLNISTRWLLHNNRLNSTSIIERVSIYKANSNRLSEMIPNLVVGQTKNFIKSLTEQFLNSGLSEKMAKKIAILRVLYAGLNIIEISVDYQVDIVKVAELYFSIGGKFDLAWFRDQFAADQSEGHYNSMARLSLRDYLDVMQRRLTIKIMQQFKREQAIDALVDQWISQHQSAYARWCEAVTLLKQKDRIDYTMFFISLHELSNLIGDEITLEKTQYAAFYDALTKLPNRLLLQDRLNQTYQMARANNFQFAVIFIDVDNFKYINDSYGHQVGDELLVEVSERLNSVVRTCDTVSRNGGDEFIIVLSDIVSADAVQSVAERIMSAVSVPMQINGHVLNPTLSVGVAVYPKDADNPLELIKNADRAMYESKRAGKNRFNFYSPACL
jgi:glutamate dehydrogenase